MMDGACDVLGGRLGRALVVRKKGLASAMVAAATQIETLDAAHPVPDASSLEAGRRVCDFLSETTHDNVLILISGGASSLIERLPAHVSLPQWQRLNQWLLQSGLEIQAVNAIRRAVSRLKGGGLLNYLGGKKVCALLLSDVPGDDPAVIGSGLLSRGDCAAPLQMLPAWARGLVEAGGARPDVSQSPTALTLRVIASNATATAAALARARQLGIDARPGHDPLGGEAESTALKIVNELRAEAPGVTVWGGETTVTLADGAGRGGRNLHLALTAAIALEGSHGLSLLVASSDGDDGSSGCAGAIVDGETVNRGRAKGLDPARCLAVFDSARFLEAAGVTLVTGPTGTNVADLAIAVRA